MAFVNSMPDLGHARVGRDFLAAVFAVLAVARQHTFQALTKRPGYAYVLKHDAAPATV